MSTELVKSLYQEWRTIFSEKCQYLVDLDNVAGDGDIGMVLSDGFEKLCEELNGTVQQDVGKLVYQCGKKLSAVAPSSMGTLLAIGMMRAGKALRGKETFGLEEMTVLMEQITEGIAEAGGAKEGEKTILDSLMPGVRVLKQGGNTINILSSAREAAYAGFVHSKDLVAKHGRIAFQGEASRGIIDPGAAVGAMLFAGLEQNYRRQMQQELANKKPSAD